MRLTLRTLLAYMDDILDPQDQKDLEKRIAESELASDLIHRTRDAARRLRLGAPPIEGEAMEIDPNIAAEYLDNTLSPEVVTEFEKVCLESDVNLAEVASCHHVLTMVLGEPAEIDPDMRNRMYQLPQNPVLVRRGEVLAASNGEASAVEPSATKTELDHSAEVPDYLRPDRSWVKWLAIAASVLLLGGAAAFFAYGPNGLLREKQLADNSPIPALGDGNDDPTPAPAPNPDGAAPPVVDGTTTTPIGDVDPGGTNTGDTPTPTGVGGTDVTLAPIELPTDDPRVGGPVVPDVGNPVVLPDVPPVIGDETPMVADPTPDTPTPQDPPAGDPAPTVPPVPVATDTPDENPPVVDEVPAVPSGPLGEYVSVQQLLLRHNGADDKWIRLAKGDHLMPGDILLALPTYRPVLALSAGLRLEMSDATRVVVDVDESGPVINLTYGRLLVANSVAMPVVVTLVIDDLPQRFELAPRASVAVDVERHFVPGMPIGQVASPSQATVYVPGSNVTRIEPDGTALPIETPTEWQITAKGPGPLAPLAVAPVWLKEQKLDLLPEIASRNIEQAFDTERPARVQLLGIYENTKRSEERDLAARCAVHVGQFTPFVKALADSAQRSNWDDHIEMLRSAIAASPELAAQVKQSLAVQRGGDEAEDLYEMIRGYSREQLGSTPQELQTGVLQKLIGWLENDRLEYRVLAFHNLEQLTGKGFQFQPSTSQAARDRSIRTWRERLKSNELIPLPQEPQ